MALVLALEVLAGLRTCSAEPGQLEFGTINFRDADVRQVLDVYKTLLQVEFIYGFTC
jgi:hypothetical protein